MIVTATIRYTPSPPFVERRGKGLSKEPLYKKLRLLMLAVADQAHTAGGIPRWKVSRRVLKYGGITGTLTGRLRRGWRPVHGEAKIENRVPYAPDFYYGHKRRLVHVPAHVRKTKHGPVKVRAHYRYEPAQVPRPINWTLPWIEKAARTLQNYYEMR
jgi:hypothetical protein